MKKIVIPTVSLTIICIVTAVLLAFTNQATAPKIEELAVKNAKEAQSAVLEAAVDFEDKDINFNDKTYTYQIGTDKNGKEVGYVFTTTANGYGGVIKVMTGVDLNGIVTRVQILELSETAGLGMNAQNDGFKQQFKGHMSGIAVTKSEPKDNEIKAITGATITSKAVTKAVNEALDLFNEVTGGEN